VDAVQLHVRFFGHFAIRSQAGWRSGPPPKKGRDLLQYLGAYPRRVATRDELAGAFWPGAEPEDMAHRIHLAASGARKYLREMLDGHDAIECVPGGYVWHPSVKISSDAEELLALCQTGTTANLEAAATLYAGEFLAGEVADWLQPLRVRCASAYGMAIERLADQALQRGDSTTALSYGLQLVEAEPGHEGATRLVMQCFINLGQRMRAFERYEALAVYLYRHLGVGPTPETAALAADLRRENRIKRHFFDDAPALIAAERHADAGSRMR
jgi:DNA-binding SARP family transcriptional activator